MRAEMIVPGRLRLRCRSIVSNGAAETGHQNFLTFVLIDNARLEAGQDVEGPAQGLHAAECDVVHGFLGFFVCHLIDRTR